ncbi:hypothetical protein YC2023_115391 [Brassica napus]
MTKARWRWWRLSWKRKAQGKFRSVYRPSMDWCWASEEIEKRSPLSYKSTIQPASAGIVELMKLSIYVTFSVSLVEP